MDLKVSIGSMKNLYLMDQIRTSKHELQIEEIYTDLEIIALLRMGIPWSVAARQSMHPLLVYRGHYLRM